MGLKGYVPAPLHVKVENAREMYQSGVGAHPDQSKEPKSLQWYDAKYDFVDFYLQFLED